MLCCSLGIICAIAAAGAIWSKLLQPVPYDCCRSSAALRPTSLQHDTDLLTYVLKSDVFVLHCKIDCGVQQLLQEVERVLFLVSAVSRLKGQWQMATQGALGATGLLQAGGPFVIRQASCAFLDFAALAADHQQHPWCLPVSAQEKVCVQSLVHLHVSHFA